MKDTLRLIPENTARTRKPSLTEQTHDTSTTRKINEICRKHKRHVSKILSACGLDVAMDDLHLTNTQASNLVSFVAVKLGVHEEIVLGALERGNTALEPGNTARNEITFFRGVEGNNRFRDTLNLFCNLLHVYMKTWAHTIQRQVVWKQPVPQAEQLAAQTSMTHDQMQTQVDLYIFISVQSAVLMAVLLHSIRPSAHLRNVIVYAIHQQVYMLAFSSFQYAITRLASIELSESDTTWLYYFHNDDQFYKLPFISEIAEQTTKLLEFTAKSPVRFIRLIQKHIVRGLDARTVLPDDCPICLEALDPKTDMIEGCVKTKESNEFVCRHRFHRQCIRDWLYIQDEEFRNCPLCRTPCTDASGRPLS